MSTRVWLIAVLIALAGSRVEVAVAQRPGAQERLAQHRNLGQAFYENPSTPNQAVAEFRRALDLSPGSNREKLNYGLALLRAGRAADALPLLKEVQDRDPAIPHTWFNLGIYYKKAGDLKEALRQFERLVVLAPAPSITSFLESVSGSPVTLNFVPSNLIPIC